jgi:hypothetical protein
LEMLTAAAREGEKEKINDRTKKIKLNEWN